MVSSFDLWVGGAGTVDSAHSRRVILESCSYDNYFIYIAILAVVRDFVHPYSMLHNYSWHVGHLLRSGIYIYVQGSASDSIS